jgi:hypothetical protein
LENDVRGGKQRAAGIGDHSTTANAGVGSAIILSAEQRDGGA